MILTLAQSGGTSAIVWIVGITSVVGTVVTLLIHIFPKRGEQTPEMAKMAHDTAQARQAVQLMSDNLADQFQEIKIELTAMRERALGDKMTAAQLLLSQTTTNQTMFEGIKWLDHAIRGNGGGAPGLRSMVERVHEKIGSCELKLERLDARLDALEATNRADRARVAKGGEPAS